MFPKMVEEPNHCGGGVVKGLFDEDDDVFQLLEHSYDLIEDGVEPMKLIKMAMFIAILESYHLGLSNDSMNQLFQNMLKRFQQHYQSFVQGGNINHGEE